MKQSAAKTLGVAVVGAAFAAAAAGTAAAVPVPDSVPGVVPVHDALTKLPAGAPQALPTDQAVDPVGGLLGGLPLAGGLPAGGGLPGLS